MDRSKNRVSKEKKEFLQEGWSMASLCRSYKSSKKLLSTKIKYQLFLLLRRRSSFLDAYLILIFYFLARQDLRFTSHQLQQHIVHFLAPIFGSVSFIKCLFLLNHRCFYVSYYYYQYFRHYYHFHYLLFPFLILFHMLFVI